MQNLRIQKMREENEEIDKKFQLKENEEEASDENSDEASDEASYEDSESIRQYMQQQEEILKGKKRENQLRIQKEVENNLRVQEENRRNEEKLMALSKIAIKHVFTPKQPYIAYKEYFELLAKFLNLEKEDMQETIDINMISRSKIQWFTNEEKLSLLRRLEEEVEYANRTIPSKKEKRLFCRGFTLEQVKYLLESYKMFEMAEIMVPPKLYKQVYNSGNIQIKNERINDLGTQLIDMKKPEKNRQESFNQEAKILSDGVREGKKYKVLIQLQNFKWQLKLDAINSTLISNKWKMSPSEKELEQWEMQNRNLLKNYKEIIPHNVLRNIVSIKKIKTVSWKGDRSKKDLEVMLTKYNLGHMLNDVNQLNDFQQWALLNCLKKPFTIIQGPPGTGKTRTSAMIVKSMKPILDLKAFQIRKDYQKNQGKDYDPLVLPLFKILVTADSNKAVDNLTLKLIEHGVKVVRVASKKARKDPSMEKEVRKVLHKPDEETLQQEYDKLMQKLKEENRQAEKEITNALFDFNNVNEELSIDVMMRRKEQAKKRAKLNQKKLTFQEMHVRTKQIQDEIMLKKIREADVIAATLQVAAHLKTSFKINAEFICVLVDEATQTTEPRTLLSINNFCQKLVLVGDQNQLGPVISMKAEKNGFKSMFERLIEEGHDYIMLNTQYRMHPLICKNSSEHFYKNLLKSGIKAEDREKYKELMGTIFLKDDPRIYLDVSDGVEEKVMTSYINRREIFYLKNCLAHIMEYYNL